MSNYVPRTIYSKTVVFPMKPIALFKLVRLLEKHSHEIWFTWRTWSTPCNASCFSYRSGLYASAPPVLRSKNTHHRFILHLVLFSLPSKNLHRRLRKEAQNKSEYQNKMFGTGRENLSSFRGIPI